MRRYDWTTLATLARCEQEFVLRHGPRALNEAPSPAQRYGQAVHSGLRALREGRPNDVREAVEAHFPAEVGPPEGKKAHLIAEHALALLALHAEEFPPQAELAETLWVERYAEHPTEPWCGIVDWLRRRPDGRLSLVDTKTTGLWLSPAWCGQWAYSGQLALYWDLAEAITGEEVAEAWVDAVHVANRKAGPQKDDLMRVGPFEYSPAMRARLRAQRWHLYQRAEDLRAKAEPGRNTEGCFRYMALCPFLQHCTLADPSEFEVSLDLAEAVGTLVRRPWVPKERT